MLDNFAKLLPRTGNNRPAPAQFRHSGNSAQCSNYAARSAFSWQSDHQRVDQTRRQCAEHPSDGINRPGECDSGPITGQSPPNYPRRAVGVHQHRHGVFVHIRHPAANVARTNYRNAHPIRRQNTAQGLAVGTHCRFAGGVSRNPGYPRNEASELTIAIWPWRRRRMRSAAGWTVLSTPSTLVRNMARACAGVSPSPAVLPEMPAFAITRSSGLRASAEKTQSSTAGRSVTSMTPGTTSAPADRQWSQTSSNRTELRPESARKTPGSAYSSANAAPIPLDAPLIRIDFDAFMPRS